MTPVQTIQAQAEEKIKRILERMRQDFGTLRTGRASQSLLQDIKVNYNGTLLPLQQVAGLGFPDARTIEIRPWDPSALPEIEKAIQNSGLGVTPTNNGKVIWVKLPTLTEERRKELAKVVKRMAEDYRIQVRNERREAIELLKKSEKLKEISEDDRIHGEHLLQKLTDSYIHKLDELLQTKEKEIEEV